MNAVLKVTNIVILANNFNPAIPTKDWLMKQGIFEKEPINFINTNVVSLFESDDYTLEIDPQRLNYFLKKPELFNIEYMASSIIKYINALPETPYTAIGYNVHWNLISAENNKVGDFFKENYCNNISKISSALGSINFNFGLIISHSQSDVLITVKILPIINSTNYEIAFNFHKDLKNKNENNKDIKEFLNNLSQYYTKAKQILEDLIKGG